MSVEWNNALILPTTWPGRKAKSEANGRNCEQREIDELQTRQRQRFRLSALNAL